MTAFGAIRGHRRVKDALIQAHHRDAVHHAYLFAGPEGIGKRTLAHAFAMLVNCTGQAPTDAAGRRVDSCGRCRSCRMMTREGEAGHPDLMVLEPDGRYVKIKQVRDMIGVVPFPPIEAAYRFVLLDPADAMQEPAANALLKTLEEPSSRTRFILVTSRPDSLLVTIRSRCQRVGFTPLTDEELSAALTDKGLPAEQVERVTPLAEGSVGTALRLIEDPVLGRRDELVEALARARAGDILAAFGLAGDLFELREALPTIFDILLRTYRDALMLRVGAGARVRLNTPHLRGPLEHLARRYGEDALLFRLTLIEETRRGIDERNLNPRLGLERLLSNLTAPAGAERATLGVLPT